MRKSVLLFLGFAAFFAAVVVPVSAQVPSAANMQLPGGGTAAPQTAAPNSAGGPKGGCQLDEVRTDLGCFPNNPVKFVQKFYGIGLGFVAGVSLLTLMIGGYDIIASRGDQRRLNIGKSYIFYSIAGLLLAIFGYVIIRTIIVDVLRVPGFS